MTDAFEWIKSRSEWLKIDRIAKDIGMPGRTLKAWVDGERPLPSKWEDRVKAWVNDFIEHDFPR